MIFGLCRPFGHFWDMVGIVKFKRGLGDPVALLGGVCKLETVRVCEIHIIYRRNEKNLKKMRYIIDFFFRS